MSVNLLSALILSSSCEVVSRVQTKTLGSAAPDLHRKKTHLLPPTSRSAAALTKNTDSEIYCTCCQKI